MFRFIAFSWDATRPAQFDVAQLLVRRLHAGPTEWCSALVSAGFLVFYSGAKVHSAVHLHDHVGVIVGRLFRRGARVTSDGTIPFSRAQTASVIASGGRRFVTDYWGRYVAFLRDPDTGTKWILRDPSGGFPCLQTAYDGVTMFFSYMEDCVSLGLPSFSTNWDYIAGHAVASLIETTETALNEVSEVMAGECVKIQGDQHTRVFYWDPFEVASQDLIEDPPRAVTELRDTVRTCVHSWASCYSSILHRLSGGLDSSIVLACLRDAPTRPTVTCVNYRTESGNGDERSFARLAAQHAGVSLIEQERNPKFQVSEALTFRKSARPSISVLGFDALRSETLTARKVGASALFGGGGGDQLFFRTPAILTATDYVFRRGLRLPLLRVALSSAYLEKYSIWKVLWTAIRDGSKAKRPDPWVNADFYNYRKLVRPEIIETFREQQRFLHPWFRSTAPVPPGTLDQIFSCSFPIPFYDYSAEFDCAERVEPLVSQPITEICLRIPTYILTNSGWDRALARQAFAADLPLEILRRRWKGGIQKYVKDVLLTNIDIARDLLLDGMLVKARILDRKKLEEVLAGRPTEIVGELSEIFDHLSTEAWLRNWAGSAVQVGT